MTTLQRDDAPPSAARHRSPPLLPVSIVYTALFLASIAVPPLAGAGHFPSPFAPAAPTATWFTQHAGAVRLAAFLQFGAAVPLAIFSATLVDRLRFLGMNVAGTVIALFGGLAATVFAALAALVQWVLSDPEVVTAAGATRILHLLAFGAGGAGHVVPLGLLLAGASVPALFGRLLPRWVAWLGLLVAAIAELSWLSLLLPGAAYLLPAARFPAFVWMIAVGALMPSSRRELAR
jgi:hypothetical protein